ncbi:MAG: hypothetical protein R3F61_08765 [Myxococcota bacterium]
MRWIALAALGCSGSTGEVLDDYALPGDDPWSAPQLEIPDGYACFADWSVEDGLAPERVGRVWEGFVDDDPTRRGAAVTDANGNGIPEQVESWELDTAGRIVRYETGPGYGAEIVERDWDADGNLLEVRTDEGPDGEWDRIDTFTYDADGHEILGVYDVGADGLAELTVASAYDVDGNLVEQVLDYPATGLEVYTFILDATGRRIRLDRDDGDDGTVDFVALYTWDDPQTYAYTVTSDEGADGTIEEIGRIERDAGGRETYRAEDTDADGTWDMEELSEHTPEGQLARFEQLTLTTRYVVETTWSEGRRLAQHRTYAISDALVLDERSTATWGGTCP